jgi:hypothetical protein
VAEGAGPALISDNLISDADQGAILGMQWDQAATEDLVDGESPPANVTIYGNKRA